MSTSFSTPLSQRDYQRFGVALTRQRVRVELWELSKILMPQVYKGEELRVFTSRLEAYRALRKLEPSKTLCLAHMGYLASTWAFFFLMSRRGLPYGMFSVNAIPGSGLTLTTGWRKRLSRLRPHKILNFLLLRWPGSWVGVRPARLLFYGGRKSQSPGLLRPLLGSQTIRVGVHQLDYELFLAEQERTPPPQTRRYAVFLDEHLPYHWEAPLNYMLPEDYYPAMSRFFEAFEKVMALPVAVAAHPTADYETRGNPFEGRLIRRRATVEMVRSAEVVIGHGSTSLSFAVLFAKPALLLTHPKLDPIYTRSLNLMAAALGRPLLCFDPVDPDQIQAHIGLDPQVYQQYREDYLKVPETPDDLIGEVIARWALQLTGNRQL